MKTKKILSLLIVFTMCLSLCSVRATDNFSDKITVEYKDNAIVFDVEPIIENGRTLVPFRAIFEIMGCAVDYFEDENGNKTVTANRGDDFLVLKIGDNNMHFNNELITLDVPAKIKDSRTLVPIRAIAETFECEVFWDGETKTVSIYPPAGHFDIKAEKLSKTITDDKGNVLIEASAYYPVIDNVYEIPYVDEINDEYKFFAEKFISDAQAQKEDAALLLEEMGKDDFIPFEFSRTFEESYNIYGILSIVEYSYVNTGGAHPITAIEARSFNPGSEMELAFSDVIDENTLEDGLYDYCVDLFAKKITELEFEPAEGDLYEYIREYLGYVQFYLTKDSAVLFFNQGDLLPYAAGVISVEIPYDATSFLVDMDSNKLDAYVNSVEYDRGFKWVVVGYSEDKLALEEKTEEYPEDKIESEYYPVGMKTITAKALKPGNAYITIACVKDGEDIKDAETVNTAILYIDENNLITVVTESDDPAWNEK